MKVSMVFTCLNEADSINKLLNSVVNQTNPPDELVIVDAGSIDSTIKIIKDYSKRYRWIKLFVKKGVSRGKGKNIAISKAKNSIIVITDAGCVLDKNWIKNITAPIKIGYDFIFGFFKPHIKNDFELFEGLVMIPEKVNLTTPFRLSSRSVAFKKIFWEKTGGYGEKAHIGDDTIFHLNIFKENLKIKFEKTAVVYWMLPKNIVKLFKKLFDYGYGYWDTLYMSEAKKFGFFILGSYLFFGLLITSLFYNIELTLLLVFLIVFFHLFYGIKGFFKTKKYKALFYIPLVVFVKNVAFVLGFTFGKIFFRKRKNNNNF